jgi:AcrR family transcriptional regulator
MPPLRRTQEERSAAMRARLLDATISCLNDLGYAGTTTPEVARRAGVSRGAQLHHFPTKAELVIEAVEHLFHQREREFRAAFAVVPQGPGRALAAVDILWPMISGPTFYAWLELAVAARTDPELRTTVATLSQRFFATIENLYHELFGENAAPEIPAFAFALLQGLALDRIVFGDEMHVATIINRLKALAQLVFP